MKYLIIILLTVCNFQLGMSQFFAVVKDKDGYADISDSTGMIIDRLQSGHPVIRIDQDSSGWEQIGYSKDGVDLHGKIRQSQLFDICEYNMMIPESVKEQKSATLAEGTIAINLEKEKFIPSNNVLSYTKGKYLTQINNKDIWGTLATIPKEQYKTISITIDSQKKIFPKWAYEDLFNPYLSCTQAFYDNENNYLYISAINGIDTKNYAGAYSVLWVFKDGIYRERLVTHGILKLCIMKTPSWSTTTSEETDTIEPIQESTDNEVHISISDQ